MSTDLPAWAHLIADFREHFGPGVRVTHLRLDAAPGWEMGHPLTHQARREGCWAEPYQHNQAGFGPELETTKATLPQGWSLHHDTQQSTRESK
jgi:hypothetical protein